MANFFSKFFPINISLKQGGKIENPFTPLFQPRSLEMFSLSARQEFLKSNRGYVYAAVQAIAKEVSSVELRLNKRNKDGEAEEITEHEVLDLLKFVNPRTTSSQLIETTQSHKELEGNSFWLLAKDGVGKIREIWPLRPDRVTFIPSKENALMIERYVYRARDGRRTMIEAENIIHHQQFNAEGDYPFPTRGLGTVQAAALAIDTNNFTREWNKNFFLNSARPDVILKTDATLTDEDYEQLKRKFNAAFQGVDKAHKAFILEGGLEIDKLTSTQKEMDFVKQLIASRDEILAIFRVPKSVLGIVEDVNRANAEASNFVFADRTIKPKMQEFVDVLNEFLLPKFTNTEGLWFTFKSPVMEDRVAVITEYDKGHNRWLTTNDIRTAEGLEPTANGDSMRSATGEQIDEVVPQKSKPQKPTKKKKEYKTAKDAIKGATDEFISDLFKAPKKKKVKPKEKRQISHSEVIEFKKAHIKGIEQDEKEIEKIMLAFFAGLEKEILDNLKDELKGLKKKEYKLKQIEDIVPPKEGQLELIIDLLGDKYKEFITEAGINTIGVFGLDFDFNPETVEVQNFINQRIRETGESIISTTYDELFPSLREGIQNNETQTQLQERIKEVLGKLETFRAARIARTEASALRNFGIIESMKQAGATKKQWIVVAPEDDLCVTVEGEIVLMDAPFSNGFEFPPVHPNCMCGTIPIF